MSVVDISAGGVARDAESLSNIKQEPVLVQSTVVPMLSVVIVTGVIGGLLAGSLLPLLAVGMVAYGLWHVGKAFEE